MVFIPKDWQNSPSTTTPISAEALEDLEERVTSYADDIVGGPSSDVAVTLESPINVKHAAFDGGAVGDGTTDDSGAFQAALDYIESFDIPADSKGATLYVPRGTYRLSDTLSLNRSIVLQGAQGSGWYSGSVLEWDDGVGGIIVERYNTSADGGRGDWSVIRDLGLKGAAQTIPGADGIWLKARARVENCWINGFSRHGINLDTQSGSNNANNFFVAYCRIDENGHDGIFVDGNDSNAGTVIGVDSSTNGHWGMREDSFLGNTYLGCHTAQNGTDASVASTLDGGINATATTIPLADASDFLIQGGVVLIGTEQIAYNDISGDDLTGCIRGHGETTAATHSSGATVTEKYGGYAATSGGGSVYVGCYTEGGQGAIDFVNYPSISIGPLGMNGVGHKQRLSVQAGQMLMSAFQVNLTNASSYVSLGRNPTLDEAMTLVKTSEGEYTWRYEDFFKAWMWTHDGSAGRRAFAITTTNSSKGAGQFLLPNGAYIGNTAAKDLSGSGTPEGVVTAAIGSTYRRIDGGAGTCFYVKESGAGNTGWVGK